MRISRKFSLERIGLKYEFLTVEVEGDSAIEITQRIEQVYSDYINKIQRKEIT